MKVLGFLFPRCGHRAGHLKDEEVTVPLSTTKTKDGV